MEAKIKAFAIQYLLFLWFFVNADPLKADQHQALKTFLRARRTDAEWLSESKILAAGKDGSNVYLMKSQKGLRQHDRIHKLPGQPRNVRFAQYAGYVTVDPSAGRELFYYFTEADYNPCTKPLLLWLNGGRPNVGLDLTSGLMIRRAGPGCSSLGYGAMQELGPFRVNKDGRTLSRNRYSWNKVANVLFVESPAGVGFSYSQNSSDYMNSGDRRTADDSYTFLVNWFERFPQYKFRPFYIAGESYAGNYIPELAETILRHKKGSRNPVINLKGIMVGNGVMNQATDTLGECEYAWTHSLISDEDWAAIKSACGFSSGHKFSTGCLDYVNYLFSDMGDIDIYNIYGPLCPDDSNSTYAKSKDYADQVTMSGFDPCSKNYVYAYLNLPEVQKAFHANVTGLAYPWNLCSTLINGGWQDSASSMLPVYRELIATGLRIWIYSGDVDGRVPVTSTRYSINELNLPIDTPWYPWLQNDIEVGGYAVIYQGLTFATVRGAGHTVPSYQGARALTLVRSFLAGIPLKSHP